MTFIQAGIKKPIDGMDTDSMQSIAQWRSAREAGIEIKQIVQLGQQGLSESMFLQYRSHTATAQQACDALLAGWSLDEIKEWQPFFQLDMVPSVNRAHNLRQRGATLSQAMTMARLRIHATHFDELRETFSS